MSWPSLDEVLTVGKIDGYPEDECRRFWLHNEAVGWMQGSTPIRNWRSWLKAWFEKGRHRKNGNGGGRNVMWEKKTRLDQLQKEIEDHPGHPEANYSDPATAEQREEFRKLVQEAKQLRREIAEGK